MTSPAIKTIRSLPLEGRHAVYYYPDFGLLTLDGEFFKRLSTAEEFSDILFHYFLGVRKLTALRQAQKAPESVFIEPWRTCNLACTYCYAGSNPSYKKKIDPNKAASLLKKYPFKRALVFGGEPLLDAQFLLELHRACKWDGFFFSTNGLLLDKEKSRELRAKPNVRWQVSLEPPEWACRVNANGEKQINLLGSQLKSLRKSRPNFRVTIPSDAPWISIKRFVDYIADAIESWEFGISYWPARGSGPVSWLNRWIQESYELVRDDSEGKYIGKLPGYSTANYFRRPPKEGFRLFNCNAAYGSVAIGPDNALHGCHELAVSESELDVVSAGDTQEIDETKRSALVYKWSKGMNYSTCGKCAARYVCGGICFVVDLPDAACRFVTDMLPLTLTTMIRYNSEQIMGLASNSEERFNKLFSKSDKLGKEVNSAKWKRLVSGELPRAEAVELAERLLPN